MIWKSDNWYLVLICEVIIGKIFILFIRGSRIWKQCRRRMKSTMERRPLTTGSMSTDGLPATKMTNKSSASSFLLTKTENLSEKHLMVGNLSNFGSEKLLLITRVSFNLQVQTFSIEELTDLIYFSIMIICRLVWYSDWFCFWFVDVEYIVRVYTGKVSGAGTDANVFLTLFGTYKNNPVDSGERQLKTSSTNINKFESGKVIPLW